MTQTVWHLNPTRHMHDKVGKILSRPEVAPHLAWLIRSISAIHSIPTDSSLYVESPKINCKDTPRPRDNKKAR